MSLEKQLNKDSATEFQNGIDRLIEGIKVKRTLSRRGTAAKAATVAKYPAVERE